MLKRKDSSFYRFVALLIIATFIVGFTATSALAADLPLPAKADRELPDAVDKSPKTNDDNRLAHVEWKILSDKKGTFDKLTVNDIVTAAYTPGWREVTHCADGKSALGRLLWRWCVNIYWTWGSTQINRVQTTPSGQTFSAGWQYNGTDISGYYFNNNKAHYKFTQGDFTWVVLGQLLQQVRPIIEYKVYAGGGYHVRYDGTTQWYYYGP